MLPLFLYVCLNVLNNEKINILIFYSCSKDLKLVANADTSDDDEDDDELDEDIAIKYDTNNIRDKQFTVSCSKIKFCRFE